MFARNCRSRSYRSGIDAKLLLIIHITKGKNENFLIYPTGVQQMSNWTVFFLNFMCQSELNAGMRPLLSTCPNGHTKGTSFPSSYFPKLIWSFAMNALYKNSKITRLGIFDG